MPSPASGQSSSRLRIAARLSVLVYALFAVIVVVSAVTRPIANWDMLAYTGSVLRHKGEQDVTRLHNLSYRFVRDAVSTEQWTDLTEGTRYRQVQAGNAAAFVSMLPMYEVKGGYVALVSALSSWTGTVNAMRVLSLAAVLVMMAALAAAFWRAGAVHLLALTVPVMAALHVVDLASMASPDGLAAMLSVMAAAAIVVGGSGLWLAAACLACAVWVRPDMLVAAFGLPFAVIAGHTVATLRTGVRPLAALLKGVRSCGLGPWVGAAAGIGLYLLAKQGVNHPGWWAHFNFTFVAQNDSMAGFQPAFDMRVYVTALLRTGVRMLRDETWPWLTLALVCAGLLWLKLRDLSADVVVLLLLVFGTLAVRLVAFPLPDARTAVGPMLMLALAAAALIARQQRGAA